VEQCLRPDCRNHTSPSEQCPEPDCNEPVKPLGCNTTHYHGCECWEAQRNARIRELEQQLALALSDASIKHKYRADVLEQQRDHAQARVKELTEYSLHIENRVRNEAADRAVVWQEKLTLATQALELIAGTNGTEVSNPRACASQALKTLGEDV
jgi:hypothetical protein